MRRFRFAQTLALGTDQGRLEVWLAEDFGLRLRGLTGARSMPPCRGLLIPGCAAVHTWGMRFALDVAFLGWPPAPDVAVLRVDRDIGPRRLVRFAGRRVARTAVLETPAGALARLGLAAGTGCYLQDVSERLAEEEFFTERNVGLLRAAYEAIGREGLESVDAWDLIADDVVIRDRPEAPDPQTYHGREGVRQALASSDDSFEEFTLRPMDMIGVGNHHVVVVLQMAGRGRGSGVPVEERIAHLWTVESGKAVAMQVYSDPEDALRDARAAG